jgi:MFS family permease
VLGKWYLVFWFQSYRYRLDAVNFGDALLTIPKRYIYLAEIGQILASLPEEEGSTAQHLRNYNVSVYSLFNFASRIVFGSLSDSLKLRFGVQRIWFMFVACIVLAATLFYGVYYVNSPHDLLPCTMLVATTYGIGFGIGPAITSEFGIEVK